MAEIVVSNGLAKFYRWYLEQATSPRRPNKGEYLTIYGLCDMLTEAYPDYRRHLLDEQRDLFITLYGSELYPFCTSVEYSNDYACHTHPKRLAHAARFADWS